MTPFATIEDLSALWRKMTPAEQERAEKLLPIVSDSLREEARRVGVDLDGRALELPAFRSVLKSVTVDVTARALMTPDNEAPMTQQSQSALGYQITGTYLVPGGGLFIKRSELARLGLRQQKIGVIDLYAQGNPCSAPPEDQCGAW